MKSKIQFIGAVIFMAAIFASCQKTAVTAPASTTAAATEISQASIQSDDEARVSTEVDGVANDANAAIENNASFNGRVANVLGNICNAVTVVDATNEIKTITITYNGFDCKRIKYVTGVVVLSMPKAQHWSDAGATMTISMTNLKFVRVRDNKSLIFNGTKTITNVTGGRLSDLINRGTITHTITSSALSITFDDGTIRTWRVAKQRVFTYNDGIVITTTGTHTEGTVSGISEWGTTRFGTTFLTEISQPIVVRQDCDFRIVSGTEVYSRLIATITVTYGLDITGAATTCPATGNFYFKLVWTGVNGVVRTVILPY